MGDEGLEHIAKLSGKLRHSTTGDAESDALSKDSDPIDADLAALIDAWPTLPQSIKAGILAVIRAAG